MRRILLLVGLVLIMVGSFPPSAYSQGNSSPQIAVLNQFRINRYGFAVLNETVTFTNNGTAPVQIPTLHLGIPDSVVSKAAGFVNETDGQFNISSQEGNGSTIFVLSPTRGSLQPQAVAKVSVKTYLENLVSYNVTSSGPETTVFVMLNPSLDTTVSTMKSLIQLPASTSLSPAPAGYSNGNNNSLPFYEKTQKDFRGPNPSVETLQILVADPNSFQPIRVFGVTRTLTASPDGLPLVSDQIVLKNMGDVEINRLTLSLLPGIVTKATVSPSYYPPVINPAPTTIANGVIDLTSSPFKGSIQAGSNFTLTLTYALPAQYAKVSGSKVTVSLPYSPPIDGVIDTYSMTSLLPEGFTTTLSGSVTLHNANPLVTGNATFEYTVGVGWAAEQAIPAGSFLFAVVFVALYLRRGGPTEAEEDADTVEGSLANMIKTFEEKITIGGTAVDDINQKAPGTIGKSEFDEMRRRLDAARGRALQRLNEARAKAGSKKLLDLINRIGETERGENRASKDLINLYEQYYTRRMRKETFDKLLPSYKRRLDEATNHLSDSLNAAQKESKLV